MDDKTKPLQRRQLLLATAAGLSLAAGSGAVRALAPASTRSRLRLGMIGTGLRGQVLLRELLRRDDVEVAALCDIEP